MAMARLFLCIIMVLGLGIELIFGQSSSDSPNCPIEITEFQVAVVSNTSLQSGMSMGGGMGMGSGMGMSGTSPMSAKTGEQRLTFSLKSKNPSASQTVSCILWESRFINSKQDVVVKQFKSKKKIKPSKDEMIEETIFIDSKLIPSPFKIGYRITKIEYTEGAAWENANKESESNFTYKTINLR